MLAHRTLRMALLLALAAIPAFAASPTRAAPLRTAPASSPDGRLFESARIRLGTGRIVPASVFGEQILVREESNGGALAFVGAPGEDDQRGAIYVYTRASAGVWRWAQTLLTDEVNAVELGDYESRALGSSMALDGNRLIAGAPLQHRQHGAVYIYERDDAGRWLPAGQLHPTYAWGATRGFGESVALHGDRALVGSYHDDNGQGAAYVFERQTDGRWLQVQRIASHHFVPNSEIGFPSITRFGASVGLEGDTAVIGATHAGNDFGAATVFTRGPNGRFVRGAELRPDRRTWHFGTALAIEDDTIVVSASRDSYSYGAAYVYTRDGAGEWARTQMLAPRGRKAGDGFGRSLSLVGDRIAIGAADQEGRAYVFRRHEGFWWQTLRLTVPVPGPRPVFGRAVALAGETLLVGDIGDVDRCPTADGCHTGAVHAYRLEQTANPTLMKGHHTQKLVVATGQMGRALAAFDDVVLVGDPGADDACVERFDCDSGAVHVLEAGQRGSWVETQRIVTADAAPGAHFGSAIARDGDWLAVAAIGRWHWTECEGEGCGSSAVHLYRRGGSGEWVFAQRISSPLEEPGYGSSIALRGDVLVVGRSQHRRQSQAGSVDFFGLDEGSGTWRIAGTHRVRTNGLKMAVEGLAIVGEQVLVHSWTEGAEGESRFGVAVFEPQAGRWVGSQFIQEDRLVAPYLAADDDVLAMRIESDGRTEVHIYRRGEGGSWTGEAILPAPQGTRWFGTGLSVSDGNVWVGEGRTNGAARGVAHLYRRPPDAAWRLVQTLRPAVPGEAGAFGAVASIGGRTAVVSAPGLADEPDTLPGHVTIYRLLEPGLYVPVANPTSR